MFVGRRQLADHWSHYTPGLHGLGSVDCPPPNIASVPLPEGAYTGDSSILDPAFSYNLNCSSATTQAQIANQNAYSAWQNEANNAQLNGQSAPPCPSYQQPNCAAIQAALNASLASNTPVSSAGWTTTTQGQPVGTPNAVTPVSSNPIVAQIPTPQFPPVNPPIANIPQPSNPTTSGGMVPASAIIPAISQNTVAPVPTTAPATTDTLFGLPTWAVIGAAALGAFLIFGGQR